MLFTVRPYWRMKFMKLGSKPDLFQSNGGNIRSVATDLPSDMIIEVDDTRFYLHKFPLLSKSGQLRKLAAGSSDRCSEVRLPNLPGGADAFEMCAKFCYGMSVTLNARTVVAARCAAEYLEMFESVERGNLAYKTDVFINSCILRSWKDAIVFLQTVPSFLPWSGELKLDVSCLDSIASMASVDPSTVRWSYSYKWKNLAPEIDHHYNGGSKMAPLDWWVDDLCDLDIDLYSKVIGRIKMRGTVSGNIIGGALAAYASKRLLPLSHPASEPGDSATFSPMVETLVRCLPDQGVSCRFLCTLLSYAVSLGTGEAVVHELVRRIGGQLQEATVEDLLLISNGGKIRTCDLEVIQTLIREFAAGNNLRHLNCTEEGFQNGRDRSNVSDSSMAAVAELVDGYLAEIARGRDLALATFLKVAQMVSSYPRPTHDTIYRAIDMYLKEHPGMSKSEKKKICKLMDCRKLSREACMHAVQNDRLPLRVVVQVLFFEQARQALLSGTNNALEMPVSLTTSVPGGSQGSSRSTITNTEDEKEKAWDTFQSRKDTNGSKHDLPQKITILCEKGHTGLSSDPRSDMENTCKTKNRLTRIWSCKEGVGHNNGSLIAPQRVPFTNKRHSLTLSDALKQ